MPLFHAYVTPCARCSESVQEELNESREELQMLFPLTQAAQRTATTAVVHVANDFGFASLQVCHDGRSDESSDVLDRVEIDSCNAAWRIRCREDLSVSSVVGGGRVHR